MADILRDTLLELVPDEELVDDFLSRVDDANSVAATRIARSTEASTEAPDEAVEEEVEENVVVEEEQVEEEQVEEEVEAVEETVEEKEEELEAVDDEEQIIEEIAADDIEIVLDDNFVTDLARSAEFQAAVATAVEKEIAKLRAEFESKFRSLEETVEEEREWIQDTPARRKRATVSYRAKNVAEDGAEITEPTSYSEIANNTVSEIFD